MAIRYSDSLEGISAENISGGFFVGWPNPPSPENHLRILQASYAVELALDEAGDVIGYISAISDGISVAYIPQLEVLPAYQGKGIGKALVERMLARLTHLYAVDLLCDDNVLPFYERMGMHKANAVFVRNYERQSAEPLG